MSASVASWSQHKTGELQHAHCPVHGSLVVRRKRGEWVWRCADCLTEALEAMRRLTLRRV